MARTVGPIEHKTLPDGTKTPFYLVRFDKDGLCESPRTREHLLRALANGEYTDVFVFSHGWNNTPKQALIAYRRWIDGFASFREKGGYNLDASYHPILIGIVWPSTWFVAPWDQGPKLAAVGEEDENLDDDVAATLMLAEYVPESERPRYYELVESDSLGEDEAKELLRLLSAVYHQSEDEIEVTEGGDAEELLKAWQLTDTEEFEPETGGAVVVASEDAEEVQVAGGVARAPVDLVRMLSVWPMKDRAGKVGSRGISQLLTGILEKTGGEAGTAWVHLIGHSFGAKVLMSALASPGSLPRQVDSLLLLQPAVNHLCFSSLVEGTGKPGGYAEVPGRVRLPILSTFTNKDVALRKAFHLALVREGDLGEAQIAGDIPPSRFAALGGYGPADVESSITVDAANPGSPYEFNQQTEVIGVRSHEAIRGHGDVRNTATHWMLYSLVKAAQGPADG